MIEIIEPVFANSQLLRKIKTTWKAANNRINITYELIQ